jgi:hypothetical protein
MFCFLHDFLVYLKWIWLFPCISVRSTVSFSFTFLFSQCQTSVGFIFKRKVNVPHGTLQFAAKAFLYHFKQSDLQSALASIMYWWVQYWPAKIYTCDQIYIWKILWPRFTHRHFNHHSFIHPFILIWNPHYRDYQAVHLLITEIST